jgi:hypothetical protein
MVYEAKIACESEVAAAAKAIAGDGGDDRLGQVCDCGRAGIDRNFVGRALIPVLAYAVEFRDIGSHAEVRAPTGQDDCADVIIVGEARKYARKLAPHVQGKSIARLWSIEAYNGDAILFDQEDIPHFLPETPAATGFEL